MSWVVRSPPPPELEVDAKCSLWVGPGLVDIDDPTAHEWVDSINDALKFADLADAVALVLTYSANDWGDDMVVEPAPISAGR